MCTNAVSGRDCEAYFSNCLFIPKSKKTNLNKAGSIFTRHSGFDSLPSCKLPIVFTVLNALEESVKLTL